MDSKLIEKLGLEAPVVLDDDGFSKILLQSESERELSRKIDFIEVGLIHSEKDFKGNPMICLDSQAILSGILHIGFTTQ